MWDDTVCALAIMLGCALLLIPWTLLGRHIDRKTVAEFDG